MKRGNEIPFFILPPCGEGGDPGLEPGEPDGGSTSDLHSYCHTPTPALRADPPRKGGGIRNARIRSFSMLLIHCPVCGAGNEIPFFILPLCGEGGDPGLGPGEPDGG